MAIATKILNVIFNILFVEAILFTPAVLMIATSASEASRTLKYEIPLIFALTPYFIRRKTKDKIDQLNQNKFVLVLVLIAGICFLVSFTGLMVASCSDHPPF